MPIVNITLIKGRPQDKKAAMYREVTDAIHRTLGAPRESVRIILNEVEPQHFAVAGEAKTGPSS
ncbi:2-hydroxymuconate tautomerase [Azospirillum brasilense]|uniref:2-hydroxymuconate tautomerase n=1 Tax=Azospirillum brasilense TaxID=192 RepID=UPI001EDA061D|nr:2-hydroxymuconate tautomerase [Azospirillum brasilense]UKJ76550.1 2-hydroxymuconate tautomerase family protein [Azospirillum brasilense]